MENQIDPTESEIYEPPTIERAGSISELTKEGQRPNLDSRGGLASAISIESF